MTLTRRLALRFGPRLNAGRFMSSATVAKKGPEPIGNTSLAGEKIDPWHGSYHWIYERALSVASLGLVGAAFLTPHRAVDLMLGVVLPLHCHLGFGAIITDYVPKRKFPLIYPVARAILLLTTTGTIYGLYKYNTEDVGLTEGVARLWRASSGGIAHQQAPHDTD